MEASLIHTWGTTMPLKAMPVLLCGSGKFNSAYLMEKDHIYKAHGASYSIQ